MKFIIVSGEYDENGGGVIALHKLCHILNEKGHNAYIMPFRTEFELGVLNLFRYFKSVIKIMIFKFKTNKKFRTPVLKFIFPWQRNDFIVVYPENVSGNPIKAKKVVRWFLYHPGYFSKKINYASGELYFTYGTYGSNLEVFGSKISRHQLKIIHFFDEYYNMDNVANNRTGTAYCLRKEKERKITHNLSDSVCIDGLSHEEVAIILKRVKTFISYDLYTAYSWFAVLCGCESIVVPKDNMTIEQWHEDESNRIGISYGFDSIEEKDAQAYAQTHIKLLEQQSYTNVDVFISEVNAFFRNK